MRSRSLLPLLAALPAAALVACSDNGPPAGGIRVDIHADQPASAYDAYVWSLTTRDPRPVLHTDWTLTDADLVALGLTVDLPLPRGASGQYAVVLIGAARGGVPDGTPFVTPGTPVPAQGAVQLYG